MDSPERGTPQAYIARVPTTTQAPPASSCSLARACRRPDQAVSRSSRKAHPSRTYFWMWCSKASVPLSGSDCGCLARTLAQKWLICTVPIAQALLRPSMCDAFAGDSGTLWSATWRLPDIIWKEQSQRRQCPMPDRFWQKRARIAPCVLRMCPALRQASHRKLCRDIMACDSETSRRRGVMLPGVCSRQSECVACCLV